MIKEADDDKDGKVNLEEFIAILNWSATAVEPAAA
jgi:Ca2+-binding EF-hand superfamily protein